MEQLLLKMARQLDGLDEASLLALWEKYATIVEHFEPTKRWEEAALVLSFIQAKHWKNQLFNYQWSKNLKPGTPAPSLPVPEHPEERKPSRRATVIPFHPDRE